MDNQGYNLFALADRTVTWNTEMKKKNNNNNNNKNYQVTTE